MSELQEYKKCENYIQENKIMVRMIPKKSKRSSSYEDSYRLLWDCKLFLIEKMKNGIQMNENTIHLLFDEFVQSKK